MLDNLRSQRETGKFCDIVLHVGGKRFPAHRSVLAASSPYFESILRHDKIAKEEITIGWEDVDSFEILLDYMYSGNISIDGKNVDALLRLSNHFLITKLQGYCEQYLEQTELNYEDVEDEEVNHGGNETGGVGIVAEGETVIMGAQEQEFDVSGGTEADAEMEDGDSGGEKRDRGRCERANILGVGGDGHDGEEDDDDTEGLAGVTIIKEERGLTTDGETGGEENEEDNVVHSHSTTGKSTNRTRRRKVKSKYATEEWVTDDIPVARRKMGEFTGESRRAVASIQSGDDEEMLALDESSNEQRPAGQTASLAQWREGIKCPHCSYVGHSATRLEQHLSRVHEEDTTYKCRLCDFTCKWNREYYRHMKCHFDGPPYKCEDCDYTCDRIQFILSHRMRHTDERPFNCEMCPFKSRTKGNLIVHMRIHTGEKPYKCQYCDRGFAMKNTLDQHLATHRDDRPFLCDTCGFTTKYQSHLLSHKRIHTGNVFHCPHDNCNYFSPRRSQLAAHERSHSNSRSHICATCGKDFIEKSHLIRHERIHLEEKPFKCSECDYGSSRRDKLKEHVLKHHSHQNPTPYKPRKSRRQNQITVSEELSDSQIIINSPEEAQIVSTEQEVATANLIYEYSADDNSITPTTKTFVVHTLEKEGEPCFIQLTPSS